jgi:hypothetical protein
MPKIHRPVITLQFLRDHPTALHPLRTLINSNILGSYQSAQRLVAKGKLAPPIHLPNGQLRWTSQNILDALDAAARSKKAGSWVAQCDDNGAGDEESGEEEGEEEGDDEAEDDDDAQRVSTSEGAT